MYLWRVSFDHFQLQNINVAWNMVERFELYFADHCTMWYLIVYQAPKQNTEFEVLTKATVTVITAHTCG